jgi:hypothetical protein
MFDHRVGSDFRLARVGVRNATTFTGFCEYHDRKLFREIDFTPGQTLDPANKRQAVLLGFRALACEYWKKLTSRLFYRRLLDCQHRHDLGALRALLGLDLDDAELVLTNHDETLQIVKGLDYAIHRMGRWFASLESQLRNDGLHLSHNELFEIRTEPLVAAASVFTPWPSAYNIPGSSYPPQPSSNLYDVAVTVLPFPDRTWVSFLVHRRWAPQLKSHLDALSHAEPLGTGVALSKLLLLHCENLAFAPSLVEALSPAMQQSLCKAFRASIDRPVSIAEAPNIDFFRLPAPATEVNSAR